MIANVTTPTGACAAAPHVINADVTTPAGTITSVTLNYNNGSVGSLSMSLASGSTYTGTIPAGTPGATVTWSITATNSSALNVVYTGTSYTDDPLAGSSASASASPTTVCANTPTTLTATLYRNGQVVNLGAGATTIADNYNAPFYSLYSNKHMQIMAKASELSALGLQAGNLTQLTLYNTAIDGTDLNINFSIKIGQTTNADMSAFITSGLTEVYSIATYSQVIGANTFNFSTPIAWDGTSNIVVDICFGNSTSSNTLSSTATADATGFISVIKTHTALATASATACANTTTLPVTYSVRPRMSFTGKAPSPANSYSWSDGTNVVGTTNPLTISPAVTTSYTATITVAGCTTTTNAATVTATPLVAGPSTAPSTQCGTATPTAFAVGTSNGNYRWYLAPTGGSPLLSAASVLEVNDVLSNYPISTTTTFYVSILNGICESARTPVTASVNAPDAIAASSNGPVCANTPLSLTATVTSNTNSNNYTYTWSASPATGSGIATIISGGSGSFGTPASTNVTPTAGGSYIYTVSAQDNAQGCNTSAQVTVTVNPEPVIVSATATPSTICAGSNVTLNGVSGSIGVGNQTIGAGATTFGSTSVYGNPYNYWYGNQKTQYIYRASELTGAGLSAGNITALAFQNSALGAAYTMTGFTISIAATAQTVATTTPITTGFTQVYTNANQPVSAGVNSYTFSTPFVWDGTSNIVISTCWGNSNSGVSASSATVMGDVVSFTSTLAMYQDGTVGTGICTATTATNTTLTTNRPKITLTGVTGVNNTASNNWVWNPGSLPGSTVTVNPLATTTYTVTATNPSTTCSKSQNVVVTVNPIPGQPTGTPSDQCGTQIPLASVSSNSGAPSPTFKWYLVPTGGSPVQTNTSTTYLATVSATTTFYVSEISSFGCESTREPVTVTVAPPDPITVNGSPATVCLGELNKYQCRIYPEF